MTPTFVSCRSCLLTGAVLLVLGCGSGPTDPTPVAPPPPPPAPLGSVDGVWTISGRVIEATGACAGMLGQPVNDKITLTQGGVAAPYEVNGRSVDNTPFRGQLTSAGALHMSGTVFTGKGEFPTSYDLTREGSDRMIGTGGTVYRAEENCWSIFEVVATRGLAP